MSINIRKFKNTDITEILSLMPRFSEVPLPDWRKAEDISNKTRKLLEEIIPKLSEESEIFIAEENQTVLGFVLLQTRKDFFTDETHGYITELAVKKEVEGRGIGKKLLGAAEIWSRGKGYRLLVLHMLIGNNRANKVYKEFGFKEENIQFVKYISSVQNRNG